MLNTEHKVKDAKYRLNLSNSLSEIIMSQLFRNSIFILLVAVCFIIGGCKGKHTSFFATDTVIEGVISNFDGGELILQGINEIITTPNDQGNFNFNTKLDKSGVYKLVYADYFSINIYIEPGDSIFVTADFQNPANTRFTGSHELENTYLVHYEKTKDAAMKENFADIYSLPEKQFINKIEERTHYLIDDQQTFQKENTPFTEIFAKCLMDDISYDAAIYKLLYPTYYEYFQPDSTLILSETFDSFLQNIDTDDPDKLLTGSFREFLPLYVEFKANADTTYSEESLLYRKFKTIDKKFMNKTIKNLLYYEIMKEGFASSPNDAAELMTEFNRLESNEHYSTEINTLFDSIRHLLKGEIAPQWTYFDKDNKAFNSSELKGKVTYIDIWATWCGPCIRELPSMHTLREQFANQDIQFVSISIDKDKNAWLEMLKDKSKNLAGIQLIADRAWESSIVKDYKIKGIPRFIILDKEGKIFDSNAPRPSSKEITATLQKALES